MQPVPSPETSCGHAVLDEGHQLHNVKHPAEITDDDTDVDTGHIMLTREWQEGSGVSDLLRGLLRTAVAECQLRARTKSTATKLSSVPEQES